MPITQYTVDRKENEKREGRKMTHNRAKGCTISILVALLLGTVVASVFMVPNASAAAVYHGEPPIVWGKGNPYTDTAPRYWGILVGVNNSSPLASPWLDAIAMEKKLDTKDGYTESRKYLHLDGNRTLHPTIGNATWNEINATIRDVHLKVGKCDIVVFYFSGHGYNTTVDNSGEEPDKRDEGIWVGKDGNEKVSDDKLYTAFKIFEDDLTVGLILIFDCCHSGGMVDGTSDLQNIKNPYGILMACKRDERSFECKFDGKWQSIYTHYVLEGLDNAGGTDKIITPSELHDYAAPKTTTKKPAQHPTKETKVCYRWPCKNESRCVGGHVELFSYMDIRVDEHSLSVPWIGLVSLMIASVASVVYVKHKKRS